MEISVDGATIFSIVLSVFGGAGGALATIKLLIRSEAEGFLLPLLTKRDDELTNKLKEHIDRIRDIEIEIRDLPTLYVSKELCEEKHLQMEKLEDKVGRLEEKIEDKMEALNSKITNIGDSLNDSIESLLVAIKTMSHD